MKGFHIKNILPSGCLLGEGPIWVAHQALLYWVDILGNRIFSYSPVTRVSHSWSVAEHIGFVLIRENNQIIGGLKSGLHYITLKSDGTSTIKEIDSIDRYNKRIRFNDGMMDEEGNIFCCTMDMEGNQNLGKYYCYDKNLKRTIVDQGYTVANGPAIETCTDLIYTVETVGNKNRKKGIYVSQLILNRTKIKNQRLLIDWSHLTTSPDGIVIDKIGNLWVGEFGGNILRCYERNGSLKLEIPLPAWNITKIAFRYGVKTHIYATSAKLGSSMNTLKEFPNTGDLLEIIM